MLTRTTVPLQSDRLTFFPSMPGNVKSGAGNPTLTGAWGPESSVDLLRCSSQRTDRPAINNKTRITERWSIYFSGIAIMVLATW